MLERRTKITVLIFLILAVLAILIPSGKTRVNQLATPTQNGRRLPIRNVDITLAQNQHNQLFEQLRKFADKHAFIIKIRQTDPSGENFLVQMWREDVKLIAVDSSDPGLFLISFFNTSEEYPVSMQVINALIIDLKRLIEEIPNTTFTVVE